MNADAGSATNYAPLKEKSKTVPKGMAYHINKLGGFQLIRTDRGPVEQIKRLFRHELTRLGWHTKKLKVVEDVQPGRYLIDVGPVLDVEVNAAIKVLQKLPSNCGHKAIFAALTRGCIALSS